MESRIYTPYDPQSSHDLVASWFLGPRAENYVFFKECFESILKRQTDARRAYFPNDQDFITPEMQSSLAFGNSMEKLKQKLEDLAEKLSQHSVPFWSPRYNAHMNMDTSMPANLAYITTMLFNPNNVANEASPYTTQIESDVG
ncbi:hypothetical protein FRC03_008425 [Tulasnella sp. 419]|nr:hypothetical protein FRC03_008425 [Tulasnella sp. 419]